MSASLEVPEAGSDGFLEDYNEDLVARWDSLVDWPARTKSEGTFFVDLLNGHGARRVLDAAVGTGFHAAVLGEAGFAVTAVDGSPNMVNAAQENLASRGLSDVSCLVADWRDLAVTVPGGFDAVICLGNSIGHLFSQGDLEAAVKGFHDVLVPGGLLVLDQRNYDGLLDGTLEKTRQSYCCVAKDASVALELIDPCLATITYRFADGSKHRIRTYPWRCGRVTAVMERIGFRGIVTYGNYSRRFDSARVEFLTHCATKDS